MRLSDSGAGALSPPLVEVRHVSRRFGSAVAVRDLSLILNEGEITCLLGPSGCGKSTLLRMLAGFESIDDGDILLQGRLVASSNVFVRPERRGIGLVFQDGALFPHMSVLENVAFGLQRFQKARRMERALEALESVGLADRAHAWPHMLSGGEQQRVAVARALAPGPRVVLLDEPFSGLDGAMKSEVRDIVMMGLRRSGAAVLLVTHDPVEALLVADCLALMSDGALLQAASPEICFRRPVSPVAARLLGEANIIPARVDLGVAHTAIGDFPANPAVSGEGHLIFRPEEVDVSPVQMPDFLPATLISRRFLGAFVELRLQVRSVEITARVRSDTVPDDGPIFVRINRETSWAA
ncbi:MAG: ABC transporter ATP-binding protein [Alphaproteobacteria bacterium]|nr:ABC transporter ATP-binding protein [Alphaproteobacteria bacterium]